MFASENPGYLSNQNKQNLPNSSPMFEIENIYN